MMPLKPYFQLLAQNPPLYKSCLHAVLEGEARTGSTPVRPCDLPDLGTEPREPTHCTQTQSRRAIMETLKNVAWSCSQGDHGSYIQASSTPPFLRSQSCSCLAFLTALPSQTTHYGFPGTLRRGSGNECQVKSRERRGEYQCWQH